MLAVKCFAESACLVGPSDQEVEECNDCTFEFFSSACVDGGGGEGFPDNGFADVGGDEERYAGAETIALLEQLVKQDDHQASKDQLNDQEETDTGTEVAGLAVKTSEDENAGLTEREDNCEKLLRSLIQFAVGFKIEVHVNQMSTGEELYWISLEFRIEVDTDIPERPCLKK